MSEKSEAEFLNSSIPFICNFFIKQTVRQVVPDPEKPLSGFKFKCLYDKEQKGPVTEIDCILGHIISAIGQKIYVWSFINNDLVGVAFIDTQIYIHRY